MNKMSGDMFYHYDSPISKAAQKQAWHRDVRDDMTDEQYDDALMKMYEKYLLTWDEELDYPPSL
jgi:hypothetical protein